MEFACFSDYTTVTKDVRPIYLDSRIYYTAFNIHRVVFESFFTEDVKDRWTHRECPVEWTYYYDFEYVDGQKETADDTCVLGYLTAFDVLEMIEKLKKNPIYWTFYLDVQKTIV